MKLVRSKEKSGKFISAASGDYLKRIQARLAVLFSNLQNTLTLPVVLFLLSLLIYLLVRMIGLEQFPIYFFTDEAAQTILAQDFLRDHFINYAGELWPTFFENGGKYNLGLSVYAQIIPLILFGRSIYVTRMVTVFFSFLAAISVGLSARQFFKLKTWWVAVLVLSMTPVWFLHSRTAFETALAVSFYAIFIYFYLLYRFRNRKWLFAALICGALAFYSYAPMQVVVLFTGVLLLLLDGPYHLQKRWFFVGGGILLGVLSLPYIRYVFAHPEESAHQLALLDSYWIGSTTLSGKLHAFFLEYLAGLNPLFWYGNHVHELCRHVMLGYGHLPRVLAPFLVIGLVYTIIKIKDPLYRILLVVLLAAPVGASVVQLGITRILVLVIPATFFTAIGLDRFFDWFGRFFPWKKALPVLIFLVLAGGNIYMLTDALKNGPLWFRDYSLDGMQYGARQIFPAVTEYLKKYPNRDVVLSPSWANGTDVIARFMVGDPLPFELGSIDGYMKEYREISGHTTFVMTPDEYERFLTSDKFTNVKLVQILNYPDGNPGFFFVNLEYKPGVRDEFRVEQEARRALLIGQVTINGISAYVRYSMLDMGVIQQAFDHDIGTPIRTLEANPFVIELDLSDALAVNEINVLVGGTTTKTTLYLVAADGNQYELENFAYEESHPREIVLRLDHTIELVSLRIEINSVYDSEPAHVHLWEITFLNNSE
jgi:4-amino-4-deoxy-L-arabinose transferase-like glycosyltransferase